MMRIFLFLVAFTLAATAGQSAGAATLQRSVTVTGDEIRLNDIFTGSDVGDDIVVGRAPAPGKKQTLGIHRLKSIARAHGLDWKPAGRHSRSVVTRAGRLIDMGEIEIALRRGLAQRGLPKDHQIELFNRTVRIFVAVDATEPYQVRNIRMDTGSGRFTASLVVLDQGNVRKVVSLNGRTYSVIELPMLSRAMRPGDVIGRGDIEWIGVRARSAHRNAAVDLSEIIGLTPRRPLQARVPIRRNELRRPVVVAKGSIVTLELRTKRMTLSAKVKAAENGAKGQTIRVLNTRSNRTIEGVVVGPGRVVVPLTGVSAPRPTSGS